MPGWLLRIMPQIGVALAIIGAVAWIDHRGYRRAILDRDAREAIMLAKLDEALRRSEHRLAGQVAAIDADYARHRASVAATRTIIQPIITREIARETRLADPASGLTPSLLDTVNRARATGACATGAAGSIICALPTAETSH